jgi:hypothetical protein
MVTILVGTGEQQQRFVLHNNRLCSKAPAFGKRLNNGFQGGLPQSATLLEEDPKTFSLFVDWINMNVLPVLQITEDGKPAGEASKSFSDLLAFAERHKIEKLSDILMDTILRVGKECNTAAGFTMIEDGYRNTAPGSKFRLYILRSYVYMTKCHKFPHWTPVKLHDLALKCDGLLLDFFVETVSNRDSKTSARSPNDFPRCDYHQHGKDQECPYLYDRGGKLFGLKKPEPAKSSLGSS